MNNVEKYQQLERTESSWLIAKRWALFGELAAAQLCATSDNSTETGRKLSIEIQSLASGLVDAVENKNQEAIETIAMEWEQPNLDKEGLVTCGEFFANDKDQLAAFHATQNGQMYAIGYADKELVLPIEIASTYRTHYMDAQDISNTVEHIYSNLNFGSAFEECFFN